MFPSTCRNDGYAMLNFLYIISMLQGGFEIANKARGLGNLRVEMTGDEWVFGDTT